jgi:hypothetical protein
MNRRFTLRSLILLAALSSLALPAQFLAAQPAPGKAGEPQFPLASRLGLAPPPGMTLSTSFQGFEDSKNNIFMRLIAMPDSAYAEIEKTMTNQALKKQNITVEKREPFALPAGKGLLIVARQETDKIKLRKWLLIAPIGGLTALVSLEIPLAAKNVLSDAAIRASFVSLASRSAIPDEEQLALVPFRLRDLAGFKVAGVVPGRAVQLTDGAKEAANSVEHAQLVINVGPGGPSSAADRDSFARLAFSGPPSVKDMRILSAEAMRVGGQPGHELRAIGKDAKTGAEIEIVQWLRFGSGAYIRMVGFAPKDGWTPAFMRFRTVRDGLEPR